MVRYIVYSGYVVSQTDGDRHYVTFRQLCRLYKLDPRQGNVVNADQMLSIVPRPDDIHCHVRYDGKYPLFEENEGVKADEA